MKNKSRAGLLGLPLVFTVLSPIFAVWAAVLVYSLEWPSTHIVEHHHFHHSASTLDDGSTSLWDGMAAKAREFDEEFGVRRRLLQAPLERVALSELQLNQTAPAQLTTSGCHIEIDVDYHGHDIAAKTVADEAQCCNECRKTPGCCFFTFKPINKAPKHNCWFKPFFADAVHRRHASPGHNSGHLTEGRCSKAAHKSAVDAFNKAQAKKACGKYTGPLLRMWLIVTMLLASLLCFVLVLLLVADGILHSRRHGSDESMGVIHQIETGSRPMLAYIPFVQFFLQATSDRPLAGFNESESEFGMQQVLGMIWAIGLNLWYFGAVVLLLAAAHCAKVMPAWGCMVLYVLFWACCAVASYWWGSKRKSRSDVMQHWDSSAAAQYQHQQPAQFGEDGLIAWSGAEQDRRPGLTGPYTPVHTWDVRDLLPNPNDPRYMGYSPR